MEEIRKQRLAERSIQIEVSEDEAICISNGVVINSNRGTFF